MTRDSLFFVHPAHRESLALLGLTSPGACVDFDGGTLVKSLVPGRTTRRFEAPPRSYFMKRIEGSAAGEVRNEARILGMLSQRGLPVASVAAVGVERGVGVLITEALPVEATLESVLCRGALGGRPAASVAARKVALMLRELHACGVQHRDCYLVHLLVSLSGGIFWTDFGRARLLGRLALHQRAKDVAGLAFSTPERVLGSFGRVRFLREYLGDGPRWRLALFARIVSWKARRMRRHAERQIARGRANIHVNT